VQSPARSSSRGTPYTSAQILAQLAAPSVTESWSFELLDNHGNHTADLTGFVDYSGQPPQITHDTTQDVHRTMTMTMLGEVGILPLSDLVRPHYQLLMPDGGWVDFVLGTFTVLPYVKNTRPGVSWWQLQGADLSQLLVDDTFSESYAVTAGTSYVQAAVQLVNSYAGSTPLIGVIPDQGQTLPQDLGWDAGVTKLKAANDLLGAISYEPVWCDELGVFHSEPVPDYTQLVPEYVFDTTQPQHVVWDPDPAGIQETPDMASVFNEIVIVGEDPRTTAGNASTGTTGSVPFYYVWRNTNPDSPISVDRWHPKRTVIKDSTIATMQAAAARAAVEVQKAGRALALEEIVVHNWPLAQNRDIYQLVYQTAGEGLHAFSCVLEKWVHTCQVGAGTQLAMERVLFT
jgi:hypothetical protein